MGKKLTDSSIGTITSAANNDLLMIVDVSDTSSDPAGTTKKITAANLVVGTLGGSGLGPGGLAADLSNFVTISGTQSQITKVTTLVLSAASTVYLVASATFSAGTVAAYGTLRLRKVGSV